MILRPPRSTRTDTRFPYTPLFRSRIEIGNRVATLHGACRLDGAAGMQKGFEQRGLAGAGVACEGHVADVRSRVRHEPVTPVVLGEPGRSEEWRVGKECVRTRRTRRAPYHSKIKKMNNITRHSEHD